MWPIGEMLERKAQSPKQVGVLFIRSDKYTELLPVLNLPVELQD